MQNQFAPGFRSSEPELCDRMGIAFLPWSPLGGITAAAGLGGTHTAYQQVAAEDSALAVDIELTPANSTGWTRPQHTGRVAPVARAQPKHKAPRRAALAARRGASCA